jgi:acyl-CoA thioester hydrolase
MVVESEICDGDLVLSRARVAMVFWDLEQQRPGSPPEAYREQLLAAMS